MAGTVLCFLMVSRQRRASPRYQKVSPMMKSTPSWASICSWNMAATRSRALGLSASHFQVAQRSPATRASSPATSRQIWAAFPVDLDGLVVPAHRGQLLAAPVEGHDLQHLGAGVEKLDVELPDGLRVIQDEVGREGTGRSVSPAFQLDDVATVTEDGARGQPFQDVSIHDKTPFPFSFPIRARARKISTKSA